MKAMVLYANAGNGHRRAAEALAAVCEQDPRFSDVRLIDALEYTNKVFQELYANLYIETVKKAPALWKYIFNDTDQPWVKEKGRMLMHRMQSLPLVKEIRKYQPDLCFSTHFMPSDIISTMIRKHGLATDLNVVVTDYYVHASWLESYISRIYVAKEESREQLRVLKYPPKRIEVLGIPIDPKFETLGDPAPFFQKHNVDPGLPLILLSAGAFGVMSGEDMAHMLSGIRQPCNLAIICGNNKKLKAAIEKYIGENPAENINYHVLGFTTEMHEWMAMASLFIGKPGGLSTAECLACGLPMLIWNPIPGQEVFNSVYLLENGAAFSPDNITTLPYRIDELLKNPEKLERMRANARALGRPSAARDIVNNAVEHMNEGIILIPRT
ncbi:glycosyltransferase [Verrucomicrobia bacterium S94]|nr:glycosyltransferase [Verrucomicrobia bacterium S94]